MNIAGMIFNRPHLVHPQRAEVMLWALRERLSIRMEEPRAEASAFFGRPARSGMYRVENGAAIIPLIGTLVNRGAWIGAQSGLVAYEALEAQVREAMADGEVERIVLDIDSPGGMVDGVQALAKVLRRARAEKPLTAVVNDMAASAAYWLAAQADEIVISPTSMLGSIGVIYIHTDMSRALDASGLTVSIITAGERKADGNPYEPLPDSVRADIQAELDSIWEQFIAAVHEGRPQLSPQALCAMQARTYLGEEAIRVGLADRIGTLAEVLGIDEEQTMSKPKSEAPQRKAAETAAETPAEQTNEALEEAERAARLAERERIGAILALEEAKDRHQLAVKLATTTDLSAEQARELLAAAPAENATPAALEPASPLGLELTAAANAPRKDGKAAWEDFLRRKGKLPARN